MFYSADVRHERVWRVGIARNAVFFYSFVASKVRKGRSEKRGGAKDRLPKMSTKFAPRLRAKAIWKSKSLKTGGVGALLEVELGNICTTPARESGLEVKIVKAPGAGDVFGSSNFGTLQNTWQAQEFARVAKKVGRRGGFEEVLKRCVSRGRRRDFVLCDVDAGDAESVERLQISCQGSVA